MKAIFHNKITGFYMIRNAFYRVSAAVMYIAFLLGTAYKSYDQNLIFSYIGYIPLYQWLLVRSINFTTALILLISLVFLIRNVSRKIQLKFQFIQYTYYFYLTVVAINMVMWLIIESWHKFPFRNLWILSLCLLIAIYHLAEGGENEKKQAPFSKKVALSIIPAIHLVYFIVSIIIT